MRKREHSDMEWVSVEVEMVNSESDRRKTRAGERRREEKVE